MSQDSIMYPTHTGKLIAVSGMSTPHLRNAIKRLEDQDAKLCLMLTGIDEDGAKQYKKEMSRWAPMITISEMLERTRHWLLILRSELVERILPPINFLDENRK